MIFNYTLNAKRKQRCYAEYINHGFITALACLFEEEDAYGERAETDTCL